MHETSLGDRLATARKLSNLSARGLDELVGLSGGYTSRIENGGTHDVGSTTLVSYAAVLGLSLDWLVRGDGAPPSARTVRASVRRAQVAAGMKVAG